MGESGNIGKRFWSGLNYIINSFREYCQDEPSGDFGIDHKSITISKEEWDDINKKYRELEEAILDTWEDAVSLVRNLEDMECLDGDSETFRITGKAMAESIMERLEDFVDDDKVEI